jgi:hypothetical protein
MGICILQGYAAQDPVKNYLKVRLSYVWENLH